MLHTMDLWNMLVLLTTRWRTYPRTRFHYSITHIQSPLTPSRPRRHMASAINRVLTPPGNSWIFFLKIPGPGKSWKSTFGPGKFWKLKLKVLESPGKMSRKLRIFLPTRRYASAGNSDRNVSVCLSRAGIVSKRFLHHLIAPTL